MFSFVLMYFNKRWRIYKKGKYQVVSTKGKIEPHHLSLACKLLLTSSHHVINCNDIVLSGIAVIVSHAKLHVFCGRVLSSEERESTNRTIVLPETAKEHYEVLKEKILDNNGLMSIL